MPAGVTNEKDQITKYGGFYIARYEAGYIDSKVVCKKGTQVRTSIDYTDSKTYSEQMYTMSEVKSGLVTGTQWDTLMEWINDSGKNVIDSRDWGNHLDSIYPADVTGFNVVQVAGFSEFWKANNIYDIAGNIYERVSERYGEQCISRGGGANSTSGGAVRPASSRGNNDFTSSFSNTGFRPVLYVK